VHVARATLVTAFWIATVGGCTNGDGEGPRYVGRVVSVTPHQVCVGPSSSARSVTCGAVPTGVNQLPTVGECVGLFPSKITSGRIVSWSRDSLTTRVDESRCSHA
jgi:hypothetical protein